jgi:hypothetical protein
VASPLKTEKPQLLCRKKAQKAQNTGRNFQKNGVAARERKERKEFQPLPASL